MALSQPVRVVIVDDHPAIQKDVAALVRMERGFMIAGTCGSVNEALALIPSVSPHLLLLDISLGDGTAFDILEELSPYSFKVIFLTAYEEHAIKAIRHGALDYLLKPVNQLELQQALAKVLSVSAGPTNTARLVLRSQHFMQIIKLGEILYCHSTDGYTTFYLEDGRKILASRPIKEYENFLPANRFLRPHQSYLVNNSYIDKYHKEGYLVLRDGTEIPVATRRKDIVIDYLYHIQ